MGGNHMRSMLTQSVVWGAFFVSGLIVSTKPSVAANCVLYARAETGVALFGDAGGCVVLAGATFGSGFTGFKQTSHGPTQIRCSGSRKSTRTKSEGPMRGTLYAGSDVVSDADVAPHVRPSAPRSGQDAAGCLLCPTQAQTAWQTCLTPCRTRCLTWRYLVSDALSDSHQGRRPGPHARCLTDCRLV